MRVNGQEVKLEHPITLEEYLLQAGYDCRRVAVEKNGRIVPRDSFQNTDLAEADTLEIVHFVGGG